MLDRGWIKGTGSAGRLLLLVLVLGVGGCGPATGTVSGTVSYRGQPLTSGTVAFLSENGAVQSSTIGADGSYTVRNVPLGAVKITVQASPPLASGKVVRPDPARQVPIRYADPEKTDLGTTVTAGSQKYDIDLKP